MPFFFPTDTSGESRKIVQGSKVGDRTTENDPSNRYEEGHFDDVFGLSPIWQGWQDGNRTLGNDATVDIEAIRELFDEEYDLVEIPDG